MANPSVSELGFSLCQCVIHTMHVIYLVQHRHTHMPRCQSECPKMPQALQEKMREGFQNMWQVTVTGRLTPTGTFLVCDDDRGLKAERDCAWEMSRMPLNSQAGGIHCLVPTVPRRTSQQQQKVPEDSVTKSQREADDRVLALWESIAAKHNTGSVLTRSAWA